MLNFSFIFFPRISLARYFLVNNVWHYSISDPQGGLQAFGPIELPPEGGEHLKFKYFNLTGVNQFRSRIERLQYVLHSIVEYGLNEKAYKVLKRLHLIAFTCKYHDFLKITKSVALACCNKVTSRNPLAKSKTSYKYPSLTGETKSIRKMNGIHVHLWTYVEITRSSETWGEDPN